MNFQQVLQQSTLFSESYGDDLITISKRHIKSGAKFYIGVYCQFKCKYKLTAYLNEMVEINEFIFVIILIEYLCFDDILFQIDLCVFSHVNVNIDYCNLLI